MSHLAGRRRPSTTTSFSSSSTNCQQQLTHDIVIAACHHHHRRHGRPPSTLSARCPCSQSLLLMLVVATIFICLVVFVLQLFSRYNTAGLGLLQLHTQSGDADTAADRGASDVTDHADSLAANRLFSRYPQSTIVFIVLYYVGLGYLLNCYKFSFSSLSVPT